MPQFTVADVPGAFARGQQFAQQAQLRPLQVEAAQLALAGQQQLQEQRGQFSALQNQNLQGQIDQRTDEAKNKSLFNAALTIDTLSDEQMVPFLEQRLANAPKGSSMTETVNALNLAKAGDFPSVRKRAKNLVEIGVRQGDIKALAGQQQSAEGNAFNQLIADFSPEDKVKAKRRRAGLDARAVGSAVQTISESGQVVNIANVEKVLTEAKEIGKLTAQHKLKPVVDAAVVFAVGQAKAEVAKLGEERSNTKTLDVYNNAMSNLTKALDSTITGPFVGFTPAMTANAQIADGAVAMMLPLMKDVFRGAGEGTFTEGDQKILTDLIPTRNDMPEARVAKISMIDSMIRAKLTTAPVTQKSPRQAPIGALQMLQQNPAFADQFEAKFGYLPEGF